MHDCVRLSCANCAGCCIAVRLVARWVVCFVVVIEYQGVAAYRDLALLIAASRAGLTRVTLGFDVESWLGNSGRLQFYSLVIQIVCLFSHELV